MENELSAESSSQQHSVKIEEAITMLDVDQIDPDPEQPRTYIAEKSIEELAESIKANGVIHPILVRTGANDRYIIVSGERRWQATQKAGNAQIPARVVFGDYEVIALAENLSRKDLLPIEESIAADKLFKKMQGETTKSKQKELAAKLGIAESTMSEILKPVELPDDIKAEAAKSPLWSRFKLLKLAKTKDPQKQQEMLREMKRVIAHKEALKQQDGQQGISKAPEQQKKEKASARKIDVERRATKTFCERIERAIKNWELNEREALRPDVESLLKILNNFLK